MQRKQNFPRRKVQPVELEGEEEEEEAAEQEVAVPHHTLEENLHSEEERQ